MTHARREIHTIGFIGRAIGDEADPAFVSTGGEVVGPTNNVPANLEQWSAGTVNGPTGVEVLVNPDGTTANAGAHPDPGVAASSSQWPSNATVITPSGIYLRSAPSVATGAKLALMTAQSRLQVDQISAAPPDSDAPDGWAAVTFQGQAGFATSQYIMLDSVMPGNLPPPPTPPTTTNGTPIVHVTNTSGGVLAGPGLMELLETDWRYQVAAAALAAFVAWELFGKKKKGKGAPPPLDMSLVYVATHWGERGPVDTRDVQVPSLTGCRCRPTGKLVELGELAEIGYLTKKGGDKRRNVYVHEFSSPRPRLAFTPGGGLFIVSEGPHGYRVGIRGIIG